jgi:hypothetical protein
MNALQNIPEHQKPEFMRSLETMQMKDSLKMYNNLVEQCFAHCVAARDGVSFERARRTAAVSSARAPRDARDLSENRTPARRADLSQKPDPPRRRASGARRWTRRRTSASAGALRSTSS